MRLRDKIDLFPPVVCRLLARHSPRKNLVLAMTDQQLVRASGLSVATVKRLQHEVSWDNIPVGEMLAFTRACGVDFDNPASMKKNTRFLKQGEWKHIVRSPDRAHFEELYALYQGQQR